MINKFRRGFSKICFTKYDRNFEINCHFFVGEMASVKNVIIDCDPGVDDAMALLFLFGGMRMKQTSNEKINILGVTICHGNLGRKEGLDQLGKNACRVLHIIEQCSDDSLKNQTRIPVVLGSYSTLDGEEHDGAAFVHGDDGMGGDLSWREFNSASESEDAYSRIIRDVSACDWIIDTASKYDNVYLITLAPLTNIALCLRKDPNFASKISGVFTMGGALIPPGNISEVAEANVYNDALAANEVFSSSLKIHLAPLDLTRQLHFNRETLVHDLIDINPLIGLFILHISKAYLDFYKHCNNSDIAFIHDSTAVALFLIPEVFNNWYDIWIRVEHQSALTRGMTVCDLRNSKENIKDIECNISVPKLVEPTKFIENYIQALKALSPPPSLIPNPFTRKRFVLCLGGSFNPCHTNHIDVLVSAKERLEKEFGEGCVLAGFFAISVDGYVQHKLKNEAMKGIHRLEMCRMAMKDHYWMVPSKSTCASAQEFLTKHFQKQHGITSVIVTGGDRANVNKALEKKDFYSVIVGRKGYTEKIAGQFNTDEISSDKRVLFSSNEVGDISSTVIRKELELMHNSNSMDEKQSIISKLVEENLIHKDVGSYILKHDKNLYIQ